MKTHRNLALVGCWLLSWAAFVHAQPAKEPARPTQFDIQGTVTIQGKPAKVGKDTYLVQVGADYATFELRPASRTDYRLLDEALSKGKGIKVVGTLRSTRKPGTAAVTLVVDRISVTVEGNGVTDNKVEGDVQITGMLLKDAVPGLMHSHELPPDWKTDAFILHRIPELRSLPVHFDEGTAKTAENLFGRLVVMRCKMTSFDLGLRPQCFLYTCNEVQLAGK